MKKIIILIVVMLLASCSKEIPTTQFQEWGEYSFRLESRPPQVTLGMNEFILIANYKKVGRAFDLIVSYRMGPEGKWSQAIQDGHTGAYRRAMRVSNTETDVLYVHIKQNKRNKQTEKLKEDTMFKFPLNYSSSSSSNSGT